MQKIKQLWEEVKNLLHAPAMTQPLWQAVIDQMHAFETRIAALETGIKDKVAALVSDAEALFNANMGKAMEAEFNSLVAGYEARIAELEATVKALVAAANTPVPVASETIMQPNNLTPAINDNFARALKIPEKQPEQPAASSANDSSAAGENTGPASPTVQPSPDGAGQTSTTQVEGEQNVQ